LKSGACHTVLLWQNSLEIHQVKRLQVASEKGGSLLFLMRSAAENRVSLPLMLDMNLAPHHLGMTVTIAKRKGGWPVPAFTLDMSLHWSALTLAPSNNVLSFPNARAI